MRMILNEDIVDKETVYNKDLKYTHPVYPASDTRTIYFHAFHLFSKLIDEDIFMQDEPGGYSPDPLFKSKDGLVKCYFVSNEEYLTRSVSGVEFSLDIDSSDACIICVETKNYKKRCQQLFLVQDFNYKDATKIYNYAFTSYRDAILSIPMNIIMRKVERNKREFNKLYDILKLPSDWMSVVYPKNVRIDLFGFDPLGE